MPKNKFDVLIEEDNKNSYNYNPVSKQNLEYNDNNAWSDYQAIINSRTLNAKAELASAKQKSNALMQNYLRALGTYQSGAGDEIAKGINNNYDDIQNNIEEEAKSTLNEELAENYTDLYENGASREDLQSFINTYGKETGNTDYWNSLAENANSTIEDYESDRSLVLNDIANTYNQVKDANQRGKLYDYYKQISETTDPENYENLVTAYSNYTDSNGIEVDESDDSADETYIKNNITSKDTFNTEALAKMFAIPESQQSGILTYEGKKYYFRKLDNGMSIFKRLN